MNHLRVPGVVWAILIVVLIAAGYRNADTLNQWGITPEIWNIIVVFALGVLKTLDLTPPYRQQAIELAELVKTEYAKRTSGPQMRSAPGSELPSAEARVVVPEVKESSKLKTWLIG